MKYYLDCEFDGYNGPLISLALVREDGSSVNYVVQDHAEDLWVQATIIPILWKANASTRLWTPEGAALDVARFLRDDPDPTIIADWPADIRYFCGLIEFPGGERASIKSPAFQLHRVDAYPTTLPGAIQHNAWWDAMALRHFLTPNPEKEVMPPERQDADKECVTDDHNERALGEIIDQCDAAEEALSHAFYLVTGRSPEWSNLFGHAEALEEIDDACRVLRAAAAVAIRPSASVEAEGHAAGWTPVGFNLPVAHTKGGEIESAEGRRVCICDTAQMTGEVIAALNYWWQRPAHAKAHAAAQKTLAELRPFFKMPAVQGYMEEMRALAFEEGRLSAAPADVAALVEDVRRTYTPENGWPVAHPLSLLAHRLAAALQATRGGGGE